MKYIPPIAISSLLSFSHVLMLLLSLLWFGDYGSGGDGGHDRCHGAGGSGSYYNGGSECCAGR